MNVLTSENIMYAESLVRSAIAPETIVVAVVENDNWNINKNY